MNPFTCSYQYCDTAYVAFVVVVSDATGLKSTPAEVDVTVLGTGL
jgi:hypothetical protein